MKGIILELRKKHAIILTKEGDFKKIPIEARFTHIGQEVQASIKKPPPFCNHLKYAACFLIFVLLFTFYFSNQSQVYAYVTIDTNPRLKLAINQHQKVLSISALNDDAKSIIKDIDYKNHNVIQVVQSIAAILIQKKYINENSKQKFVITTVSKNPNQIDIQKLNAAITAAAADVIQNRAQIISQNTTSKKRNQAKKDHVSTGKIHLEEENILSITSQSEPDRNNQSNTQLNSQQKNESHSKISNTHRKNQNQHQHKNNTHKAKVSKKSQHDDSKKNYSKLEKLKNIK